VTPGSYVLAHSPLTGPAAWGKLPTLLREQAHEVVVINVQDDDEPPFAERYVMRARNPDRDSRAGAPWFEQAIGVDADREMLAGAAQAKIKNVQ
jgi:hypothetical protein